MIILYDNKVLTSTISAFSENPSYLFDTGLKDTKLSRVGRTVNDSTEWVKFDMTTAVAVSYMTIQAHNITSGATLKLQGNATDVWTSPTIDQSLTWDAGTIIQTITETSLRWWRITIDDPSNPDTYIEIGAVFLGIPLVMPGMLPSQEITRVSSSTSTVSESGQSYGDKKLRYYAPSFNFPNIVESKKTEIDTFWDTVENVDPFVLIIWEDDLTTQPPIYCKLTNEALEWKKQPVEGYIHNVALAFREVF